MEKSPSVNGVPYLLSLPSLIFIGLLFLFPVAALLWTSVVPKVGASGGLDLSIYDKLLGDPYMRSIIWRTIKLSTITTLASLVLAFPVALHMRYVSPRWRSIIMLVMLSPLLTSAVDRTLAWVILLSPRGILNNGLGFLGLGPVNLIYNEIGVVIGLTHVLFGYMVLSLMTSILKIDENLVLAASNLGASRWQILTKIILPLSLPGMVAGSTLVFTMSASTYVTPALLGGTSTKLMAPEIYDLAIIYLEWRKAAALSTILFVLICFAMWAMTRWAERGRWKAAFG
jgi:putative spermidine/putrescine transport system permease protein